MFGSFLQRCQDMFEIVERFIFVFDYINSFLNQLLLLLLPEVTSDQNPKSRQQKHQLLQNKEIRKMLIVKNLEPDLIVAFLSLFNF